MSNNIQTEINEVDSEYIILTKNKNDILNELDFENEEEKLLCDAIITNLEKTASENIRDMKTVSIPNIGCIRINPVKRKFRNAKLHLSSIRKNISKEQYKEYVRDFINDIKEKQSKIDKDKLIIYKIKKRNKAKYDLYYKTFGRHYAELFIYSIYWLKEIPFDAEWEEIYKSLKD